MKVRANASQIGDHSLSRVRLEPSHGFGGIRFVIKYDHFYRKASISYLYAPGSIDSLNSNFITVLHFVSYRRVATGEWSHDADFDGLSDRINGKPEKKWWDQKPDES
jgi:hypothetical protein